MSTLATQLQESHDHSGKVINLSEQNSLRKALRIVVQPKYKCKNKKTKSLMFVEPAKLQEVLEPLLRQEQHILYHAENETLKTNP